MEDRELSQFDLWVGGTCARVSRSALWGAGSRSTV